MKDKLDIFTQKLLEWNKVHNLTGAKTKEDVKKNIDDSLKGLKYLKGEYANALDIGTGAGFPGLILAIANPKTRWTLVEPRKKRASFLNYIKSLLDLDNVEVVMKRVEDMEPKKYDLITSRAVMKTKDLVDMASDFIYPDTTLLFYKGSELDRELEGFENYRVHTDGNRRYLILKGEDVV